MRAIGAWLLHCPGYAGLCAGSFKSKTEVLQYNPEKTQPGYVLFSGPKTKTEEPTLVIINMEGKVVHTIVVNAMDNINWAYMLENGNFLMVGIKGKKPRRIDGERFGGNGPGHDIAEVTWDGDLVWHFKPGFPAHCNEAGGSMPNLM